MKIIPSNISNKLGRQILVARKHSPRAMFVAGIGGVLVSTVLACRATMKLESVLEDIQNNIDEVKTNPEGEETSKAELVKVYAHGSFDIVKLYGPAVILGSASIAALTASHITLTRRTSALTAAYVGLQETFDAYRERVKAEIGEEKERNIRHGVSVETIEKDGKKVKVKTFKADGLSDYYRIFDESSSEWQEEEAYNRHYILCQQNLLNDLLTSRGHVFLNEVYEALGFERSPAGQIVGWIKEGNKGDGYIDFGMYQVANERNVNHGENYFVLDFNVDGPIWNLI